MEQNVNIAFAVGEIARRHSTLPAIIAADITVDYRKFWRITRGFATRMRELGIGRDSFVMVQTRDMIASLATLHAAALLGARYAVYSPRIAAGGVAAIGQPSRVLFTPDSKPDPGHEATPITPDWTTAAPESDAGGGFQGFAGPQSPWLLVETGGTTGASKYLWLTANQVYLRTRASQDDFTFGKTRFCALFPCNTRPFFARANAALLSACAIVDTIDLAFLQEHQVDLFCASPRTATEWLAGRRIEPRLPLIQVSGARLALAELKILLQSFRAVEDVYGASETSKTHVNRIDVIDRKVVVRGRMLDSRLEITDPTGAVVQEPGKPGLVRVASPYVNCDYAGQPDAKARVWRDGFFYSGDLAVWGPNRELIIQGRADQLINLGGFKIDPGRVEEVLEQCPLLSGAAVMAFPRPVTPPQLMALVTLTDRSMADDAISQARALCERHLPASASPALIFVVEDIPRTGDGSPRRADCAKLAEDLVVKLERQSKQDNGKPSSS